MAGLRKVLWWIYGIQAGFIAAVYVGGIARDELPFWPWNERVGGGWEFALAVYIHLVFYSVFFVLPYAGLSVAYKGTSLRGMEGSFVVISAWALATICIFHVGVFALIADLIDTGLPTWHQWLRFLWIVLTVIAFILWRGVSKAKQEQRLYTRRPKP